MSLQRQMNRAIKRLSSSYDTDQVEVVHTANHVTVKLPELELEFKINYIPFSVEARLAGHVSDTFTAQATNLIA